MINIYIGFNMVKWILLIYLFIILVYKRVWDILIEDINI